MTEAEWLACNDPHLMIGLMNKKEHSRKSRLIGCALCRTVWVHLPSKERHAVEVAEQYADGLVTKAALAAASGQIRAGSQQEGLPA
jgi:hypothetical protein